jgi:hypothetical protein
MRDARTDITCGEVAHAAIKEPSRSAPAKQTSSTSQGPSRQPKRPSSALSHHGLNAPRPSTVHEHLVSAVAAGLSGHQYR